VQVPRIGRSPCHGHGRQRCGALLRSRPALRLDARRKPNVLAFRNEGQTPGVFAAVLAGVAVLRGFAETPQSTRPRGMRGRGRGRKRFQVGNAPCKLCANGQRYGMRDLGLLLLPKCRWRLMVRAWLPPPISKNKRPDPGPYGAGSDVAEPCCLPADGRHYLLRLLGPSAHADVVANNRQMAPADGTCIICSQSVRHRIVTCAPCDILNGGHRNFIQHHEVAQPLEPL
jgi:hypothetical protein